MHSPGNLVFGGPVRGTLEKWQVRVGGDMGGGQSTATSFGVESSGGVVTILANRLKQNGVVPQSVVLGR